MIFSMFHQAKATDFKEQHFGGFPVLYDAIKMQCLFKPWQQFCTEFMIFLD